jgi:TIR domain
MTILFISHVKEDAHCVEELRKGLESQGYVVWRKPKYPDSKSASYLGMIENAILSSAALVLVWSSSAAKDEWVESHTLFAQSLRKLVFPVLRDTTSLPKTLVAASPVSNQVSCADTVAALMALPDFPPAQSNDPFIKLYERATHEFIRDRKAAIDQAAEMLRRSEHREEMLALLEYLAKNDLTMGVRDKSRQVLDAEEKKAHAPSPSLYPNDSRHMFAVRCKNGHVSYFDKRIVCGAHKEKIRSLTSSSGKELDELRLTCSTCSEEIFARVDCESYK